MSKFTVEEINFMCVFETQDGYDWTDQTGNAAHKGQRHGGAWRAGVREAPEHDR